MAASAEAIELGRTAALSCHHDEGRVEGLEFFEILDQRCHAFVEILNEQVLLQYSLLVNVPPGAVEEVEIEGNLDRGSRMSVAGSTGSPGPLINWFPADNNGRDRRQSRPRIIRAQKLVTCSAHRDPSADEAALVGLAATRPEAVLPRAQGRRAKTQFRGGPRSHHERVCYLNKESGPDKESGRD